MTEHEMEDLLATYPKDFFPRKDMVLKGRQESFSGVGRFDLLFEDEHCTNVLMELKARAAKYEDASQVAKYKTALEERGERNVLMWLVATMIPKPVRDFLDYIGIEYTEIHETEYRIVASKHNFAFESESKQITPSSNILGATGEGAKGTEVRLTPNTTTSSSDTVAAPGDGEEGGTEVTSFRLGTRTLKVFELLKDQKPHTKDEVWDQIGLPRLGRWPHVLPRVTKMGRTTKRWTIQVQGDQVTLHFTE